MKINASIMHTPLITVLTPTYNRASLLPRLYDSLCRQTFTDFEWIVVDDGSTDNTQEILAQLSEKGYQKPQTSNLKPQIIRKENGGKHTAVNLGVRHAQGELVFIADSDDMLPPDSLQLVARYWMAVREDKSFAGVCGLDQYTDERKDTTVGRPEILDCSFLEYWWKYRMKDGDMKEVYRADVLREMPFPEIPGEKFCPEELVWARIAQKYRLRYFNKVIYTADYQPSGLSANMAKIRMASPVTSMMTYAESLSYDILPILRKIRYAINFWRFKFCLTKPHVKEVGKGNIPGIAWYWLWAKPLGYIMHLRDNKLIK